MVKKLRRHSIYLGAALGLLAGVTVAILTTSHAATGNGVFKTNCKQAKVGLIDPIVSPGAPSEHVHLLTGNKSINQDSTYASMIGQATTCTRVGDTAAYWIPQFYNSGGTALTFQTNNYYFRNWPNGSTHLTPYPPDFRVVAGYPDVGGQTHGISADGFKQGFMHFGFQCENTDPMVQSLANLNCSGHNALVAVVFFPNCGMRDAQGNIVTDSADHRSHVAYALSNGNCPADHPVQFPALYEKFKFNGVNCSTGGLGCYISSDQFHPGVLPGGSYHADFWNTWDQAQLNGIVACLNTNATCA